jgi:DNA modification methylase
VIPYVADPDFTLYLGDVRDVLAQLPAESVDCCVTSPPYWGLRDYGTDGQIGLEATPEAFVAEMVAVFREVRRVLAPHGTLWLNLGDSYAAKASGGWGDSHSTLRAGRLYAGDIARQEVRVNGSRHKVVDGLKPKDLVGIPWRVAFALQEDGWYLRADVIWAKPNPMPESVTDRPTKAHEYVFLLAKSPRYFFDQEAVREPHTPDGRAVTKVVGGDGSIQHRDGERWPNGGRNVRSVWEIATQPYAEAHFATYPEALVDRCLNAGCPEEVCATCGKPRERILEKPGGSFHDHDHDLERGQSQNGSARKLRYVENLAKPRGTIGWTDCGHDNYRAGVVLDPFMGSGTTAKVARRLGRHAVGVVALRSTSAATLLLAEDVA